MIETLLSSVLVYLLAAAVLGGIICWFLKSIFSIKEQNQLGDRFKSKLNGRNRHIEELQVESTSVKNALRTSELQYSGLQLQYTNLISENQEQGLMLSESQSRIKVAEGRLMSVQRDYVLYKANKQREITQLQKNLQKILPLRAEQTHRMREFDRLLGDSEEDFKDTQLDAEMPQERVELQKALKLSRNKVVVLLTVKQELGEAYYRFAEEKQKWEAEKKLLTEKLIDFEHNDVDRHRHDAIARDFLEQYNNQVKT